MTKILFILAACAVGALGFAPSCPTRVALSRSLPLQSSPEPTNEASGEEITDVVVVDETEMTAEEKIKLGNLVADEEFAGLSMELADVVRTAVVEDLKKNSRDFLGKEEYLVGDFSKEIDSRVKAEVAKMREKDDYELGDLSVVLDDKIKELVCEMSGKDDYEFGDLSVEIDKRVKVSVADFCGSENYEFGDLSKELAKRTKDGVINYTGKSDYQFGDLTKQAVKNMTGKDDYQFGDISKKFFNNVMKKDRK
mmetsp:Transcript_10752/g.23844  ORF Transcript_10752/g.23844 Transcript_10752/m.23844 type:complete len:252 (-) Transcript_10752:290-1045(-)